MNNSKHYAAAIAAFVIWGFFAIPLRALIGYTSGQILYFRILFSLLVLIVIIAGFKRADIVKDMKYFKSLPVAGRRQAMALTLAGGAILTVNWLSFIYVVNNINVKTASFAYLICPVITAILGYVIIKEKMTTQQWIAVGLCALSCAMMGISSAAELGYSSFTALTYAVYLITQRKNQGFDRMVMLGIQTLVSFLILTFFANTLVDVVPAEGKFYYLIIIIAVFFTVFPLFLNLFALNRINSATIGILMYLNPIFNFTIAFVVFNETADAVQLTGYTIIAVALVLFNYQNFGKLRAGILKST